MPENYWGFWVLAITVLGAFAAFCRWQGKVDEKLTGLDELKKVVGEIQKNVSEILGRFPRQTFASQSPPKLTDFGKKISKELDVENWLNEHLFKIKEKLESKEEFEIFEECLAYVVDLEEKDSNFKRIIASTAYNHGIDDDQIRKIYQIELRDRILASIDPL